MGRREVDKAVSAKIVTIIATIASTMHIAKIPRRTGERMASRVTARVMTRRIPGARGGVGQKAMKTSGRGREPSLQTPQNIALRLGARTALAFFP